MTRKQRQAGSGQSVTYDLNNSRNRAAFEALLDDEDESGEDPQQLPPRGKRGEQQRKREKEKFFQLKDSQLAGKHQHKQQAASPANQEEVLRQLMDMFQGSAEPAVIRDVLAACGGAFETAVDALLGMLGAAAAPAGAAAMPGRLTCISLNSLNPTAWLWLCPSVAHALPRGLLLVYFTCSLQCCTVLPCRLNHMLQMSHCLQSPAIA